MTQKGKKHVRPLWEHWDFSTEMAGSVPQRIVRRFSKKQIEFDIAFLEDILADDPNHLETMKQLAELYTRNGQFRQGLKMDRRIVAVCPREAVAHYNLACSLSLMYLVDECFKRLNQAILLGYREFGHMALDPDLETARKDARWGGLFTLPSHSNHPSHPSHSSRV